MPSETVDMRPPVKNHTTDPCAPAAAAMQPPKPTEVLPCPRCGSASTKFCYYNNYNLSQPRYFCKGCRRYWTQGGTLRNVPVGGGTRKSGSSSSSSASKRSRSSSASKRSRSSSASSTTTTSTNSSNSATSNSTTTTTTTHEPVPVSASGSEVHHPEHVKMENTVPYGLNLNEKFQPVMSDCTGNFMSLLNCQEPPVLQGMGMSGYGSGFGYGFYDGGLGFGGRGVGGGGVWSYPEIGNGNGTDGEAGVGGAANPGCNTWEVGHDVVGNGNGNGNGNDGNGGDYFGWPGLAISTPGKAFK